MITNNLQGNASSQNYNYFSTYQGDIAFNLWTTSKGDQNNHIQNIDVYEGK